MMRELRNDNFGCNARRESRRLLSVSKGGATQQCTEMVDFPSGCSPRAGGASRPAAFARRAPASLRLDDIRLEKGAFAKPVPYTPAIALPLCTGNILDALYEKLKSAKTLPAWPRRGRE